MLAFFSVHLKQLREAKKLTQTQVANYVGVSRSVISAYENDMRYPSYEILIRLSMAKHFLKQVAETINTSVQLYADVIHDRLHFFTGFHFIFPPT